MTSREYSVFAHGDTAVQRLLDSLVSSDVDSYRQSMIGLGQSLAKGILKEANASKQSGDFYVVCTVEDADFLARGVIDGLQSEGICENRIHLHCVWNEKIRDGNISLSPISRQYAEDCSTSNVTFVIVKSVISGACVVKTNLTRVLTNVEDADVVVASPVMLNGAMDRLASEFPAPVSDRFKYVWFATDFQKDENENLVPGIGGAVYQRLGFDDHLKYVPNIVKTRRNRLFQKSGKSSTAVPA